MTGRVTRAVMHGRDLAPPVDLAALRETRRAEPMLQALCGAAKLLPALIADDAGTERARLIAALERGEALEARFQHRRRAVQPGAFRALDALRRQTDALPGAELYARRLDELELDLALLSAIGQPRLVRPLSARRFGDGGTLAPTVDGPVPLRQAARVLLERLPADCEPTVLSAMGESESLEALVQTLARQVGLQIEVRVEPRLSAGAAAGERTVFVAARRFGRMEAKRLAVHEVLGHLVSADNGRKQPLRLLELGTAGAFVDQEGLALWCEEQAGLLDGARLRTLAARVIASDMMHRGASFAECSRSLHRDEGFSAQEAVVITERAYRGGGVARDSCYLLGWLRVHDALERGTASADELRMGRVSLDALPGLRALAQQGYVRGADLRPNFSRSFFSHSSGTTPRRSPPSDAASLIRLELTKK